MAETKFKALCIEQGWTARTVSEKTGIKKRTIHSYFDGSRSPSRTTRKKLRDNLGIDTQKLFED